MTFDEAKEKLKELQAKLDEAVTTGNKDHLEEIDREIAELEKFYLSKWNTKEERVQ